MKEGRKECMMDGRKGRGQKIKKEDRKKGMKNKNKKNEGMNRGK